MAKELWKPGNMLYPLPVVMVSSADKAGNTNILTIAWTGTVCSDPAMVYVSVRKERHSYNMIKETGEFVINLTTEKLAFATDFCGVKSGRDIDKFEAMGLTREKAEYVSAPLIKESPVNIECKVTDIIPCGSHDMFMADVVAVHADDQYMDEKGRFDLAKANPIVYSHGEYYCIGQKLGKFGYSVKKSN
ncbi:MAG: flavin reductase family protein [Eubacterium sp.]